MYKAKAMLKMLGKYVVLQSSIGKIDQYTGRSIRGLINEIVKTINETDEKKSDEKKSDEKKPEEIKNQ